MSNSRKFLYTLTDEEKRLFSFELSKENIPYVLFQLKHSFNETYQYLLNIFKKVFSAKKSNNVLYEDIKKFIQDLQNSELDVLRQYKIMLFYLQIANTTDINNAKIILEFENQQEKNELMKMLNERKNQLLLFVENLKKLEELKNKVNATYEKIISQIDLDNID